MIERFSLLLQTKNLSPSQFADEIKVQRSSLSHVMNGRNKASLEFVQKILKRYPDISSKWLLFGEGPMFEESTLFSENIDNETTNELNIENQKLISKINKLEQDINTLTISEVELQKQLEYYKHKSLEKSAQIVNNKETSPYNIRKGKKKIEKILTFFTDKTFKEYYASEEE